MCCRFFCNFLFEHLRCILECCHMLYFRPSILIVCDFYCPSGVTFSLLFSLWYHMGICFWCICFYFSNLIFWYFSIFGIIDKSQLLIGWENCCFLDWFTGWSSSGYVSTIGNLRGSEFLTGFDYKLLFIWVPSWFTDWSFFWPTTLTGTLGDNSGGFVYLNICDRFFNSSLCP